MRGIAGLTGAGVMAAAGLAAPTLACAKPYPGSGRGDICYERGRHSVAYIDYPRRISWHRSNCHWVRDYYDSAAHEFAAIPMASGGGAAAADPFPPWSRASFRRVTPVSHPTRLRKAALGALASAIALGAAPGLGWAQPPPPPPDRPYDYDACQRAKGEGGVAGALIGGVLGGLLGSGIAAHGHRTTGTVVGAGAGAIGGAVVGSSAASCNNPPPPPAPPPSVRAAPPPGDRYYADRGDDRYQDDEDRYQDDADQYQGDDDRYSDDRDRYQDDQERYRGGERYRRDDRYQGDDRYQSDNGYRSDDRYQDDGRYPPAARYGRYQGDDERYSGGDDRYQPEQAPPPAAEARAPVTGEDRYQAGPQAAPPADDNARRDADEDRAAHAVGPDDVRVPGAARAVREANADAAPPAAQAAPAPSPPAPTCSQTSSPVYMPDGTVVQHQVKVCRDPTGRYQVME
jgi:hypothetical protein